VGNSLTVPLHPALLFAGALGLGLALQALFPLRRLSDNFTLRVAGGAGLSLLAAALGAWALLSLRRAGQEPDFGKQVSVLVQAGPYRLSRNPLYVALILIHLSLVLFLANWWLLALLPFLAAALDRLVIAREERFLATRFGGAFQEYRQKVRRWA
jgi:protein-S-isoprenylcysteine O-methyltransferase Ste14